jgi:hypothetical protein
MRHSLAAFVLVTGCDTYTGPDRDLEPPIQTEDLLYELKSDGFGLRVDIPYTFTNSTDAAVYLTNCNGAFGLHLEREVDEGWKVAWSPALPMCLSPPIVIERNETFLDTLRVRAGEFGSNSYPQFDIEDPHGIYRIVWTAALASFDANASPFGQQIPIEHRISNRFELER